MSTDLDRTSPTDFGLRLKEHYRTLDEQSQALLHRDFSLVERFVTKSKLAKLADRLAVEEQEEALRFRLESMQLARVSALNEMQIKIKGVLGVKELEVHSALTDRAGEVLGDLFESLAEQELRMVRSFEDKLKKAQSIELPELRERFKKSLGVLFEEQERVIERLMRSTGAELDRLREAYEARSAYDRGK